MALPVAFRLGPGLSIDKIPGPGQRPAAIPELAFDQLVQVGLQFGRVERLKLGRTGARRSFDRHQAVFRPARRPGQDEIRQLADQPFRQTRACPVR